MSVSLMKGKGSLTHNNRDFIYKNVDKARVVDNIIYKKENLKDVYKTLFDGALAEYNVGKRKDRVIDDYYKHIEMGQGKKNNPKLFYETVVQVGKSSLKTIIYR